VPSDDDDDDDEGYRGMASDETMDDAPGRRTKRGNRC
jgi:hypothetical protein